MSHARYLKELLEPIGIYDVNANFNGGELEAVGQALDQVMAQLDDMQREMSLVTAESWGLRYIADALAVAPVVDDTREYAEAMARLLRIGGDSFTVSAIADTIKGCGVLAHVAEGETLGKLVVTFPNVAGIPNGFDEIKKIIVGILPAQVEVFFDFWYRFWEILETLGTTWTDAQSCTWYTIATGES